MFKELLPIGSVVLLKGGIKKIMVTGIKPVSKDDDGTEQEYRSDHGQAEHRQVHIPAQSAAGKHGVPEHRPEGNPPP